jgi:glucosamine 6-phosphate synthetase-like amidotransferase/phosphosugar isomerase protein
MEKIEKTKTDIWPLSYKSLIKDLIDEPSCLNICLDKYINSEGKDLLINFKKNIQSIQFSKIFFIGNTFNYFASLIPKHCIMSYKEQMPFTVFNFELTEFYDYFINQLDFSDSLFVFISKSGSSRLLLKSIEYIIMLRVDPHRIILITDNPTSDIAKNCGFTFPIYVGSELILGTKSFQNTVLVLHFIMKILLKQDPFDQKEIGNINQMINAMTDFGKEYKPIAEKVLGFLGRI